MLEKDGIQFLYARGSDCREEPKEADLYRLCDDHARPMRIAEDYVHLEGYVRSMRIREGSPLECCNYANSRKIATPE